MVIGGTPILSNLAATSAPPDQQNPGGPTIPIIYPWIFIILCITSLTVNLAILSSVYFLRAKVSPTLYISLSLALVDIFGLLLETLDLILYFILPHLRVQVEAPCTSMLLLILWVCNNWTEWFHLVALAGNAYIGTALPLKYHIFFTKTRKNVQFVVILLWIVPNSLLISNVYLLQREKFKRCSPSIFSGSSVRKIFAMPFFLTLVLVLLIYSSICKLIQQNRDLGPAKCSFEKQPTFPRQINKNTLVTTLMIVGSAIVFWTPAFVYFTLVCEDCLLSHFWNSSASRDNPVVNVIDCLFISKTVTNSLIYALRMKEIKVALRRMWQRVTRNSAQSGQETPSPAVLTGALKMTERERHLHLGDPCL